MGPSCRNEQSQGFRVEFPNQFPANQWRIRMAQTSTHLKSEAGNAASEFMEKASDQVGKVADQIEGAASRLKEQGREAGQQVQEVAGNFKGAVEKSVEKQPMATLLMAAAVGFVLGALWKS